MVYNGVVFSIKQLLQYRWIFTRLKLNRAVFPVPRNATETRTDRSSLLSVNSRQEIATDKQRIEATLLSTNVSLRLQQMYSRRYLRVRLNRRIYRGEGQGGKDSGKRSISWRLAFDIYPITIAFNGNRIYASGERGAAQRVFAAA